MSRIITFYSYKGGVGRTFALANVAVLLAKRGKRVLIMDWDLEAPGLHRYFKPHLSLAALPEKGLIHLLNAATQDRTVTWSSYVTQINVPSLKSIDLIPSGDRADDYAQSVQRFSWSHFFEKADGGAILDRWREEWKRDYDFVLVDSRTGITDTGGVCTVFLPDILVLVFSANAQSFERGLQVAHGIQKSRRELSVSRPPLAILPLPGRFDGRDELTEAEKWMTRFSEELKPFYNEWLPKRFTSRNVLEVTKVPYITKFSFGEPLIALTHSVTDPELPGYYLDNVARLLCSDFADASHILSGGKEEPEIRIADFRQLLAQRTADASKIQQELESLTHLLGYDRRLVELYLESGVVLWRQGNISAAEDHLRKSSSLCNDILTPADPVYGAVYSSLGEFYRATRRTSEAEAAFRHFLETQEKYPTSNSEAVFRTHMSLAGLFEQSGRVEEAIRMYLQATSSALSANQKTNAASAYVGVGELFGRSGRMHEASDAFRQALSIYSDVERPREIAETSLSLAMLLSRNGRMEEALHVNKEAIQLLSTNGAPPDIARAYANLGSIQNKLGDLASATDAYHYSLRTYEELGMRSAVLETLLSLADIYRQSDDLDRAIELYYRALDQSRTLNRGRFSSEVYSRIAELQMKRKDFEAASKAYQELIALQKKSGPNRAEDVARPLIGLGEVRLAQGDLFAAEALTREGIESLRSASTRNSPMLVRANEMLARIYRIRGDENTAFSILKEVDYDLFISHDAVDRGFVVDLVDKLTARGVRVYPLDTEPSKANWADELAAVMRSVSVMIVCMGQRTAAFQMEEVQYVLERAGMRNVRVIPVLLPGAKIESIPKNLRDLIFMDLRMGVNDQVVEQLVIAMASGSRS